MPVQGMPGPALIQPVQRASSLEQAVLFKVCPAIMMTHASTPVILVDTQDADDIPVTLAADVIMMTWVPGLKKAFEVVVLVTLGSPCGHHLIVFDSVATCELEDDAPGLCPGGGIRVSDDDAVRYEVP
eukprot:2823426-Rhodomonas_salina.2